MAGGGVLALDYGTKRVGVASGTLKMKIAFPREVIPYTTRERVLQRVKELVQEWEIALIVVGLPLNMEEGQKENPVLPQVMQFVEELERECGVTVKLFDERLSTFEAGQLLEEMGVPPSRSHELRDALAAQVILQRYFQSLEK